MKGIVHRKYFFCNHDMSWNIFDSVLLVLAVGDLLSGQLYRMAYLRVFRLLKIVRILKVFRMVHMLSEVRLMLASLLGSFASLLWALVLLTMILFVFALIIVQGLAVAITEEDDFSDSEAVLDAYGNLPRAMLSLYKVGTGGDDWSTFYDLLPSGGSQWCRTIFIFYVSFMQIAVMNIITAVFIERAQKLALPDREDQAFERIHFELAIAEDLRRICEEMDVDKSNTLTRDEVHQSMENERVKHYLRHLGIDIKDVRLFFNTIPMRQCGENHEVGLREFINHCMRMRGTATSLDMQTLLYMVRHAQRRTDTQLRQITDSISKLGRKKMAKSTSSLSTIRLDSDSSLGRGVSPMS